MTASKVRPFTLFLAIVTAVLLVRTLALSPVSRQAPSWAASVTFAMLVLQLLIEGLPGLASRLPKLQADSLFGASEHLSSWQRRAARERPKGERVARTARIVLWISGFTGLVYGFGFLVAVPVFLVPYLRMEARLTWIGSLLVAGVATGLLYLVFSVLFGLPLPAGAIG